jgi:hypothetical protein
MLLTIAMGLYTLNPSTMLCGESLLDAVCIPFSLSGEPCLRVIDPGLVQTVNAVDGDFRRFCPGG